MSLAGLDTLLEVLAFRAEDSPAKAAFTFDGRTCSYAELWQGVEGFAGLLLGRGLEPGGRVVIALPNGPEFFFAFYGAQRAGGVAVPVYPGAGPGRITDLARLCGAKIVVAPSGLPAASLDSLNREVAGFGLQVVTVAEQASSPARSHLPPVQPGDVAFLQYTSGSTGNPKGVILTQDNLLTNVRQMIAGMEITPEEIFVSWLPVYHDMGLILMTMVPFYLGAQAHLLPANLREARPWLEAIQAQRGTFTAAPDFAYRLVLRHLDPGEFELSSLRVALNAAEPVRAGTISAFERAFGLKNVMVAGYGLAEATVGVSMAKPGTAPRVDDRGRVSAGRPFPGVELRILAGDEILPVGESGEIAIRSQANCQGYFGNPDETARLFWRDGYLRSGDLGYLDRDGCLFITGRQKNIIKRSGETISPQEIEELVDAQPEVRYSAAVGIDQGRDEGEQAYVFAEIRDGEGLSTGELHEMALQIVADFYERMGFRPARVYLLKPRTIPLTHNGKLQHGRLKEMYLDGTLRRQGSILFPEY